MPSSEPSWTSCARSRARRSATPPAAPAASSSPRTTTSSATNPTLDKDQKKHLKLKALRGVELVDGVARLCAMNLLLHGVGPTGTEGEPPIKVDDSLRADPGDRFDVVLTNPPFGKKSSVLVVNEEGEQEREALTVVRDDFWASTTNKQLNFVQHVKTLLKINGRAAVVVPDNVLFEGGAGETVRRKLLHECDVHTLLRLPTGIFYAQGVKANVLFFDRKPASETPWTKKLWVYDLRTNKHFTLKTRPAEAGRPRRLRRLLPPREPARPQGDVERGVARRPLASLRLRGAGQAGQVQPRRLLAAGREPGGLRQPAAPRRHRRRDRRGSEGGAGAVRGDPGGPGERGLTASRLVKRGD